MRKPPRSAHRGMLHAHRRIASSNACADDCAARGVSYRRRCMWWPSSARRQRSRTGPDPAGRRLRAAPGRHRPGCPRCHPPRHPPRNPPPRPGPVGTPVCWKGRSTPSSSSPEAAALTLPQAAERPCPRSDEAVSVGRPSPAGRPAVHPVPGLPRDPAVRPCRRHRSRRGPFGKFQDHCPERSVVFRIGTMRSSARCAVEGRRAAAAAMVTRRFTQRPKEMG
jgi:hypothetical protein